MAGVPLPRTPDGTRAADAAAPAGAPPAGAAAAPAGAAPAHVPPKGRAKGALPQALPQDVRVVVGQGKGKGKNKTMEIRYAPFTSVHVSVDVDENLGPGDIFTHIERYGPNICDFNAAVETDTVNLHHTWGGNEHDNGASWLENWSLEVRYT